MIFTKLKIPFWLETQSPKANPQAKPKVLNSSPFVLLGIGVDVTSLTPISGKEMGIRSQSDIYVRNVGLEIKLKGTIQKKTPHVPMSLIEKIDSQTRAVRECWRGPISLKKNLTGHPSQSEIPHCATIMIMTQS
jgi:hypothetical protein